MLIKEFQKIIDQLILHVSSNLDIDESKVKEVFNSFSLDSSTSSIKKESTTLKSSDTEKKPPKPKPQVSSDGEVRKCPYVYSKSREGEVCGVRAGYEVAGKFYCSTHAKYEQKRIEKANEPTPLKKPLKSKVIELDEEEEKIVKKTVPSKTITKANSKSAADEKSARLIEKVAQTPKVKLNKWGNYEDQEYHVVWSSDKTKVVGNQLEDGKIGGLTQDQIDYCEMNGWKFEVKKTLEKEKVPVQPPKPSKESIKNVDNLEEQDEDEGDLEENEEDIDEDIELD